MNVKLIIRGFLYKKNWTPISCRKKKIRNYTIDFFQCQEGYIDLINNLKIKHNVSLYFSTYDTTPIHVLQRIQGELNPEKIFISPEKNSSQFTTTVHALNSLMPSLTEDDLIILIRSDLIIKYKLIEMLSNFEFSIKDKLYVLTKEKPYNRKTVIDVLHVFSKNVCPKFLDYVSRPNLIDAHKINRAIPSVQISENNSCSNTGACEEFFKVYSPKPIRHKPSTPQIKFSNHKNENKIGENSNKVLTSFVLNSSSSYSKDACLEEYMSIYNSKQLDKEKEVFSNNSFEKKTIYVDIDNTITTTIGTEYKEAKPIIKNIQIINNLYNRGHHIVYWTARGSGSGIDYQDLTKNQLESWGCLYHELKFNKPVYDLFIDDKSLPSIQVLENMIGITNI